MSKPKLFLMCGISGSGKTTFARRFAESFGLHYISPDDFYALYNGDERKHKNEFEIWMSLFRALHMAEQDGASVIFDTNAPTMVDRTQILNWFPDFEHHMICITAPPELCKRNNKSRRRVIPDDVMEKMIQDFQVPCECEWIPRASEWAYEKRWQSITILNNESNEGFELTLRQYRGNIPPLTRIQLDRINRLIREA